MIHITTVSGALILPYLPALGQLRIKVFREFPYLYEGNQAYEEKYLASYTQSPLSLAVLAWIHDPLHGMIQTEGKTLIGASTATPLNTEPHEVIDPFIRKGLNAGNIFYLGESVLLKEFRGRGIGHAFFDARESFARKHGFTHTAFYAVKRPDNHPRRPPAYVPHDRFWNKRGYTKDEDLLTHFSWKDLDENTESPKPMLGWIKRLAASYKLKAKSWKLRAES